jgi:hypothetical protein
MIVHPSPLRFSTVQGQKPFEPTFSLLQQVKQVPAGTEPPYFPMGAGTQEQQAGTHVKKLKESEHDAELATASPARKESPPKAAKPEESGHSPDANNSPPRAHTEANGDDQGSKATLQSISELLTAIQSVITDIDKKITDLDKTMESGFAALKDQISGLEQRITIATPTMLKPRLKGLVNSGSNVPNTLTDVSATHTCVKHKGRSRTMPFSDAHSNPAGRIGSWR